MRPVGFVWKKANGACKTVCAMRLCMLLPARFAAPKNIKLRVIEMPMTLAVNMAYTYS